jgi:hypothetical protein
MSFLKIVAAVPAAAAAGRPVTDTTISTAARLEPPVSTVQIISWEMWL